MKTGRIIAVIALLFVGLIAVNYLASSIPFRIDGTEGNIYTLSPGTKSILSKLDEPVKLEFYFSRSTTGIPISFKNYAARVQEMLRQYVRAGHGKLQLSVIDPKPDTPEEEKATAAGLEAQPLPTGESVYFGLVAVHADQQKTITFFSPQREQFLEYDLSQLIHRVQQFNQPKLGLLTSLPLRGQMDMMAMQSGRMPQSQFVISEWEYNFQIVPVEPTAKELPGDLDALAVIHPQDVSPQLQYAIDQYLLSGKPVFLALDPSSRQMRSRNPQQNMMYGGQPPQNTSSDLPTLLKAWGIDYSAENVVADLENATRVQTGAGQDARFPAWISLGSADLNRTSPATSQLESLLFVEPGTVSLRSGSDLKFTPLIETSAQSGTVASMMLQFGQPDEIARQMTVSGKKTLAALVQGRFKSAFPNGLPEGGPAGDGDKKDDTAKEQPAKPAANSLKESKGTSTLLIVADTDWLFDDYSVRRLNFLGSQAAEPLNDNLAFAGNALDYLSGSEDLISIRGKGSSQRPFTVVRKMEAEAQQKYQKQLTSLETELNKVQEDLRELQGKRSEGNRLVATPEMAQAIEEFQKKQASMRAERRQIRANLREGIESLENRLIIINLLSTPLLVGAFGIWFHRHRRR